MRNIRLTETDLRDMICESLNKLSVRRPHTISNTFFTEIRTMQSKVLNEVILRPLPIEVVMCQLVSSYRFAYEEDYSPRKNIGIVGSITLNNDTEVICVCIAKRANDKDIVRLMANYGWLCSAKDLPCNKYPSLKGLQFEKKKDYEATERVHQTRYIYHCCPNNENTFNKIRKNGLCPKMGSWNQFNPKTKTEIQSLLQPSNEIYDYSCVYFFLHKPSSEKINSYFDDKNQIAKGGYYPLQIDTRLLPLDTTFYYDPREPFAVYTLNNISPNCITNLPKQSLQESKKKYANEIHFGRWTCIVGGEYYNIEGKGKCRGIRMYIDVSSKESYFLFQRENNRKYFYCTIVPASEKGAKEAKFVPLPYSKVPQEIRRDCFHPHL